MATDVDNEIEAIRAILNALEPLDSGSRESVLDYVLKRLGLQREGPASTPSTQHTPPTTPPHAPLQPPASPQQHIKELREEKKPRSAIEMAVIVAYYLAHLAPATERKSTVVTSDLDTYFKIAEFKLPRRQEFTLVNAKNAGYFDSVGGGEYKLNAVGHNLVVHSMPRKGNEGGTTRKRSTKKTTSKKATTKKKSSKKKSTKKTK
jgi:hypothetical protein